MKKPVLIIMAAGVGSRYGGLKQLDPIDELGHLIIDYSLFDARRAGFETVLFIVRPELEPLFRQTIGGRISKYMEVRYVHQLLADVPQGFSVPPERTRPWGTAHAVMSAGKFVDSSFAVMNADDYYGPGAIKAIYDFLSSPHRDNEHAMVGYKIENTLTEYGSVSRGICRVNDEGYLCSIEEYTQLEKWDGGAVRIDQHGRRTFIPPGTIVSMNLWGFGHSMMDELVKGFPDFLNSLHIDPLKREYFLPSVINTLVAEARASVKVLLTEEKWYGITYPEDKQKVHTAIRNLIEAKKYPQRLWEAD